MKKNYGKHFRGRLHTHYESNHHDRKTKTTEGGSGELCGADDDDIITEAQSPLPQQNLLFSAPQGYSLPAGRGFSNSETHNPECTCLCVCVCVVLSLALLLKKNTHSPSLCMCVRAYVCVCGVYRTFPGSGSHATVGAGG